MSLVQCMESAPGSSRIISIPAGWLTDTDATARFTEAEAVLTIRVARVFPNCGRYIHRNEEISPFVPQPGRQTPIPDWKRLPVLREVLPAQDPARTESPA